MRTPDPSPFLPFRLRERMWGDEDEEEEADQSVQFGGFAYKDLLKVGVIPVEEEMSLL